MAHPARREAAERLASDVGAVGIAFDLTGAGEVANGNEAWRLAVAAGVDWAIVLQDDAVPIPGFKEHAETALTAAPAACVSFYTGTGRPRQDIVRKAVTEADEQNAAWLQHPSLLWGVAVALRADLAAPFLDWEYRRPLAYDQRLSVYCKETGTRIAYTHPSLTDHADGPTLLTHSWGPPRSPRRAWRLGPQTGNGSINF